MLALTFASLAIIVAKHGAGEFAIRDFRRSLTGHRYLALFLGAWVVYVSSDRSFYAEAHA